MAARTTPARLGLLLGQRNYQLLRELLAEMNEVDIARFLEDLPPEQAALTFRTLPKNQAMDVFAELEPVLQQHLIEGITDKEITALLEDLAVDDAVDMLEEFPAELAARVLKNARPHTRELLNQYLRYPENSVGSIMTAEYTDLKKDMTVAQAIHHIRTVGEDRETIYTCYVIDRTRLLLGVVTVRDLMLAGDDDRIEEVMETNIIAVTTAAGHEEAARLLMKYDLMSLPVVDASGRLVGLVTVDDAVDVLQEEATEDFERLAGMAPSEKPYLKTGVLMLARNRFFWLLILMLSGILTGAILDGFEAAFIAVPMLVRFIPMLSDTSGDAGSQVSTLVIRGMALGEIEMKDFWAIIWKELRVSFMVGLPLGVVNFLRIIIGHTELMMEGLVVSITLVVTIALANVVGGILPMGAKLLKQDPALMATPLIATLVDALSLLVYFSVAVLLLGL